MEPGKCGGDALNEYCRRTGCELGEEVRVQMAQQVRDAAYEIIERKGATYYAVAVGLLRIVESILRGQHTVRSVSSLVSGHYGIEDVYLSQL